MRELPSLPDAPRDFESLVNEHRRGLRAFLLTIVQDYHLAEDILQETLSVVANRWAEEEIRDFWSFAREVARRQALKAIRQLKNQPVSLSEEAIESLHAAFDSMAEDSDESRTLALQGCLKKLPRRWMKILNLRYWEYQKINAIALALNTHANVVSVTINRAKSRLADCVSASLATRRVKS
ncbi:MAG: sigma-70 family RNA polymerase sigma factor [Verrucomicrobiales bacterium]|nr:sigma-70 family RNA polymerase sigma factor [Verrucomicrobiales bacterium]